MSSDAPTPHDVVPIRLGRRSYDIVIGCGALEELGARIGPSPRKPLPAAHAVVVVDAAIEATYGRSVVCNLAEVPRVDCLPVPPGESSKSVERLETLWNDLLRCGTDRNTLVVAVGGGVVGDLAGFAAATYARGIRLVQVPTTLLAQVDSSVGGKTAINLAQSKNMVGAFWQPSLVVIDPLTLQTLPDREFRAGMAEVVKYGMILASDFLAYLEDSVEAIGARDARCLAHVIRRSCEAKGEIVEADERETSGRRAVLNYGHTFAHAFETVCGYGELRHGEAVAIGMECAARLAVRLGMLPPAVAERQAALLDALRLPRRLPRALPIDALLEAMQHDKKTADGVLRLVLPVGLGEVRIVEGVARREIAAVLRNAAGAGDRDASAD